MEKQEAKTNSKSKSDGALEKDLTKLGLSDKEAKVYLASLVLGASAVQAIAKKSKVNRATTYVIINSLTEMGLMSTFTEGKKTFFVSSPPSALLDFLKNQQEETKNKIKLLEERMPELKMFLNSKDKPVVKYYEGVEGIRAVQMDFVETLRPGEEIYAFLPLDDCLKSRLKEKVEDIARKRSEKGIKMKIIYTSKIGEQKEYIKKEESATKKYCYVDYKKYPFSGEVNIYADKIFMIDYLGKTGGLVIENKTLANTMVSLFKLIWDVAKK